MKTIIQIFCACIPFPRLRRPLRAKLKHMFHIEIKKPIHINIDEKVIRKIERSRYFNAKYYIKTHPELKNTGISPIIHYLTIGYKHGYNPSEKFDNDFYLFLYPDIKNADMNPLLHYVMYGRKEGRKISKVSDKWNIDYNAINVEPDSILLVTHEMSLTGAPIALQKMANILQKHNRKFIVLSPFPGDLEQDFKQQKIPYIVDTQLKFRLRKNEKSLQQFMAKFDSILLNTIVSLEMAPDIHTTNNKMCWVHEGEFGFTCESRIMDIAQAFEHVDKVYSVGAYSQSFTDKYIHAGKSKTLLYGIDDIDFPKTAKQNDKLRFGIFGVCCERKGHDLFIRAIKEMPEKIRKNCEFIIVGKINNDEFYNKLKRDAEKLGITFTGQLSHSETIEKMSEIDIVVCPSLDDPMPIVCTEAAVLSKPIICSNCTGTAGFVKDGVNGFVYNLDNDNLSDILVKVYKMKDSLPTIGAKWRQVYDGSFNMNVFDNNVLNIFDIQKEKCLVICSDCRSKDVPYSYMLTKAFRTYIAENTGNLLIANYGIRQQDYDFVFIDDEKRDKSTKNVMFFCANILRSDDISGFDYYMKLLKDPSRHCNIMGVGAQTTLEQMNPKEYASNLSKNVINLAHAMSERVVSIGVRGEFTAEVLNCLGIKNVDVIGCPSWFVNGYNQPIITKKEYSTKLKPAFQTCWEPYSQWHSQWHRALLDNMMIQDDPKFIIQSEFNFLPYMIAHKEPLRSKLFLSPEDIKQSSDDIQKHFALSNIEILRNEKINNMFEIFSDLDKWAQFIKTRDVSFGFRIHGSIMAIKNGVPAICIVTDSRTYEMCKLFKIPFVRVDEISSNELDFRKIYEEADFTEMNKVYPKLLENYKNFLDKNGIKHKL